MTRYDNSPLMRKNRSASILSFTFFPSFFFLFFSFSLFSLFLFFSFSFGFLFILLCRVELIGTTRSMNSWERERSVP